jgi:hypothetical protein
MKANPDKFQAIAIGKIPKSQNLSFNLSGNKIVCEDNVKLLGVTISWIFSIIIDFFSEQ